MTNKETIQSNGVVTRPNKYEILSVKCLSSSDRYPHKAAIKGVIDGACECGNCKIRVRQHRYHKGAYIGTTSHHDYVYDREEVLKVKDDITK